MQYSQDLEAIFQAIISPLNGVAELMSFLVGNYGWWPVAASIIACLIFAMIFDHLPAIQWTRQKQEENDHGQE